MKGYGDKAPTKQTSQVSSQKLQQIFSQYKDGGSGKIEVEGLEKFFGDLGLDPSSPLSIVLSKYMKASTMGEYTF